jgi:hypothetical protein
LSHSPKNIEPAYLDLQRLSSYTSISIRALRDYLKRPDAPPVIRLPGKILVSKVDIDAWLARFRQAPGQDLAAVVDEVLGKLKGGAA